MIVRATVMSKRMVRIVWRGVCVCSDLHGELRRRGGGSLNDGRCERPRLEHRGRHQSAAAAATAAAARIICAASICASVLLVIVQLARRFGLQQDTAASAAAARRCCSLACCPSPRWLRSLDDAVVHRLCVAVLQDAADQRALGRHRAGVGKASKQRVDSSVTRSVDCARTRGGRREGSGSLQHWRSYDCTRSGGLDARERRGTVARPGSSNLQDACTCSNNNNTPNATTTATNEREGTNTATVQGARKSKHGRGRTRVKRGER